MFINGLMDKQNAVYPQNAFTQKGWALTLATTRVNLENITLMKAARHQRSYIFTIPFIRNVQNRQIHRQKADQ